MGVKLLIGMGKKERRLLPASAGERPAADSGHSRGHSDRQSTTPQASSPRHSGEPGLAHSTRSRPAAG